MLFPQSKQKHGQREKWMDNSEVKTGAELEREKLKKEQISGQKKPNPMDGIGHK